MGSATSILAEEANKPEDVSDIGTLEDAKLELMRLRALIKENVPAILGDVLPTSHDDDISPPGGLSPAGSGSDDDDCDEEVGEEPAALQEVDNAEKAKIAALRGRGRRSSVSAEADHSTSDAEYVPKVVHKTAEAMTRIAETVQGSFLFNGLDDAERKTVFDAMEEKKVEKDSVVIQQGDINGDYFYVVDSGKFDVTLLGVNEGKQVLSYGSGQSFGELALMYNCPRAASVTCVGDGVLWALDRNTFKKVVIGSMSKKRQKYETFLEKVEILKNLTPGERSKLADVIETVAFEAGTVVINEGDSDYDKMKLYFVESGTAVATVQKEGETIRIGTMEINSYFGEKALIERAPRAATVIADDDIKCVVLDVAAFERLMGPCRDIMERKFSEYKTSGEVYDAPISPKAC